MTIHLLERTALVVLASVTKPKVLESDLSSMHFCNLGIRTLNNCARARIGNTHQADCCSKLVNRLIARVDPRWLVHTSGHSWSTTTRPPGCMCTCWRSGRRGISTSARGRLLVTSQRIVLISVGIRPGHRCQEKSCGRTCELATAKWAQLQVAHKTTGECG
jgi:hypothetical protein